MGRKKKGMGKFIVAGVFIVVAILAVAYMLVPSVSTFTSESLQNMGLQSINLPIITAASLNNYKTVRGTEDVWTGQNVPGNIGYPNRELFELETYKTTTGTSDAILIKGNIYKSAKGQTSVSQRAYYSVYILEIGKNNNNWKKIVGVNYKDTAYVSYLSGNGWIVFKSSPSDFGAQTMRASTCSMTLKGLHKNGALKVEFVVEFLNAGKRTFEKVMATDYAALV